MENVIPQLKILTLLNTVSPSTPTTVRENEVPDGTQASALKLQDEVVFEVILLKTQHKTRGRTKSSLPHNLPT